MDYLEFQKRIPLQFQLLMPRGSLQQLGAKTIYNLVYIYILYIIIARERRKERRIGEAEFEMGEATLI